jgi:Nup93/Nic96
VNTTIEDWLWARLFACKFHPPGVELTSFKQLQSTVSQECGEQYFIYGEGGSHLFYFTALILTGQLERAIHTLYNADLVSHAVHVAIHCNQMKLLVLADDPNADICKSRLCRRLSTVGW